MHTLATTPILVADGFHAPSISDFFPDPVLFAGTPFEVNRIIIVRLISLAAVLLIFGIGARRAKLVPGRFQSALEFILNFCRNSIVYEILGEQMGKRYVPLITTIFISIFFFNITGIVPFLNVAGTSLIGLPLIFALWVFVMYLGAGVKRFGVGGYLKHALFMPGVPKPLYVLLTPVEFLQVFLLRPGTLTIRLFANMLAGHMLLALCFAASSYLFFEAAAGLKVFGLITVAGGFGFFMLEAFVAALQAYVFAILTAVYIQMSVEKEH